MIPRNTPRLSQLPLLRTVYLLECSLPRSLTPTSEGRRNATLMLTPSLTPFPKQGRLPFAFQLRNRLQCR
jgi:hypothetical protein